MNRKVSKEKDEIAMARQRNRHLKTLWQMSNLCLWMVLEKIRIW